MGRINWCGVQRVDDLDLVASLQFKAKTASFAALSPFALVQADMKCFQSTSGDSRTIVAGTWLASV